MAEYLIQDVTLINIAEAIRNKTGKTGTITPAGMATEISLISGGGGMESVTTESEMDAKLVATNVGKVYKYTGTTANKYTPGDIYIIEEV